MDTSEIRNLQSQINERQHRIQKILKERMAEVRALEAEIAEMEDAIKVLNGIPLPTVVTV